MVISSHVASMKVQERAYLAELMIKVTEANIDEKKIPSEASQWVKDQRRDLQNKLLKNLAQQIARLTLS